LLRGTHTVVQMQGLYTGAIRCVLWDLNIAAQSTCLHSNRRNHSHIASCCERRGCTGRFFGVLQDTRRGPALLDLDRQNYRRDIRITTAHMLTDSSRHCQNQTLVN
jgi:hypothetical protein